MLKSAEQVDEIAYLKIILDSLVENRSFFDPDAVDVNRAFLEDLRSSVDSALRNDGRVKEDIRMRILHAFNVLIDKGLSILRTDSARR